MKDDRNLLDVAKLTDTEVKSLFDMPADKIGLFITMFCGTAFLNFLSIVEVITMPLVTDKDQEWTEMMTYDFHFAYLLFFCVGCSSATAFFVYKRFLLTEAG
jgi:hypothetical protein